MNLNAANKARIATRRRCAVESRGEHAILNYVQERAPATGGISLDVRSKNEPLHEYCCRPDCDVLSQFVRGQEDYGTSGD